MSYFLAESMDILDFMCKRLLFDDFVFEQQDSGSVVIKIRLDSAGHENFPAHKCNCWHYNIYEQKI